MQTLHFLKEKKQIVFLYLSCLHHTNFKSHSVSPQVDETLSFWHEKTVTVIPPTWVNRVMLLHPRTPRPNPGWGATKVDLELVLHSPSTGTMGDHLRRSTLRQQVKDFDTCVWIVSQITWAFILQVQSCHLARFTHSFLNEKAHKSSEMIVFCFQLTLKLLLLLLL